MNLHAGSALNFFPGPTTGRNLLVPSDGQVVSTKIPNPESRTIYIKKLKVWVYNPCPDGGFISGGINRVNADGSNPTTVDVWQYPLTANTAGSGPQGNYVIQDFSPDYMQLDPGQFLIMEGASFGFVDSEAGVSMPSEEYAEFWYTLIP